MVIDDATIEDIVKDTLTVEIGTIKARIRNKNGIVDQSKCDHNSQWDYNRNICMRCGITKLEILRSIAGKRS
jgi:hypothetical protein